MVVEYERVFEEARLKLASSVRKNLELVLGSYDARERLGDRLDLGGAFDIPGRTGPEVGEYHLDGGCVMGAFPVYDHEVGSYVHGLGARERLVGINEIPFERYRADKLLEIAKKLEDAHKPYSRIGNEGLEQLKAGQRVFYHSSDRGFKIAEVVSTRSETGRVQIRFNTSARNDTARLTGRELIVNASEVYL